MKCQSPQNAISRERTEFFACVGSELIIEVIDLTLFSLFFSNIKI